MVKSERQASDGEEQETRRQASKCPENRRSSGQARDGEVRQSADMQVMEKSKRQASDWGRARDMQERHATDRGGE